MLSQERIKSNFNDLYSYRGSYVSIESNKLKSVLDLYNGRDLRNELKDLFYSVIPYSNLIIEQDDDVINNINNHIESLDKLMDSYDNLKVSSFNRERLINLYDLFQSNTRIYYNNKENTLNPVILSFQSNIDKVILNKFFDMNNVKITKNYVKHANQNYNKLLSYIMSIKDFSGLETFMTYVKEDKNAIVTDVNSNEYLFNRLVNYLQESKLKGIEALRSSNKELIMFSLYTELLKKINPALEVDIKDKLTLNYYNEYYFRNTDLNNQDLEIFLPYIGINLDDISYLYVRIICTLLCCYSKFGLMNIKLSPSMFEKPIIKEVLSNKINVDILMALFNYKNKYITVVSNRNVIEDSVLLYYISNNSILKNVNVTSNNISVKYRYLLYIYDMFKSMKSSNSLSFRHIFNVFNDVEQYYTKDYYNCIFDCLRSYYNYIIQLKDQDKVLLESSNYKVSLIFNSEKLSNNRNYTMEDYISRCLYLSNSIKRLNAISEYDETKINITRIQDNDYLIVLNQYPILENAVYDVILYNIYDINSLDDPTVLLYTKDNIVAFLEENFTLTRDVDVINDPDVFINETTPKNIVEIFASQNLKFIDDTSILNYLIIIYNVFLSHINILYTLLRDSKSENSIYNYNPSSILSVYNDMTTLYLMFCSIKEYYIPFDSELYTLMNRISLFYND